MPTEINDTFQVRIHGQLIDCIKAEAYAREVVKNSYSIFFCNYTKITEIIGLKIACDSSDTSALWVADADGNCQNADTSYTAFAKNDLLYTVTTDGGETFTTTSSGNVITGLNNVSGKSSIYTNMNDVYALTNVPKGTVITLLTNNVYTLYTKITTTTAATTSTDWISVGSSQATISSYLDLLDKPDVYYGIKAANETDADAITRVVGDATVCYGDITILKSTSDNTETGDEYNTSVYIKDATAWRGVSSKLDIDHIMLNKNFALSGAWTNVGNIKKSSATYIAKGKSLYEVLDEIFNAVVTPTVKTLPTIALSASATGSFEIGTSITQNFTITLTDGKYDCAGDESDIESFINSYAVEYSGTGDSVTGENLSLTKDDMNDGILALSGSPGTFNLPPNYNKRFSLYANVKTNKYAVNNHNETSLVTYTPTLQSKVLSDDSTILYSHTGTTAYLSSYRQGAFYGTINTDYNANNANIIVRALNKLNQAYPTSDITRNFNVVSGAKAIIIAVISGSTVPVVQNNTVNSPYDLTLLGTASINDAAGANPAFYDIYQYKPDIAFRTTNNITVTFKA